jgi:hypothetical protein
MRRRGLIERDRSLPVPRNPLDNGICPVCRCLIPREKHNVRRHQSDHDTFQAWADELGEFMQRVEARLEELEKRTGIAEEAIDIPVRYSIDQVAFYPDSEEGDSE